MDRDHILQSAACFYLNDLSKFNVQNLIKLAIANSLGKIISMIDIPVYWSLSVFSMPYSDLSIWHTAPLRFDNNGGQGCLVLQISCVAA